MELTVFSLAGAALCAAFFFAGLLDAIAGGGGLVSLPTFLAVGFPVHYIMGTSQCSTIPGNIISVVEFARSGKVHWKSSLICIPFCIVGAYLGARLNILVPEDILKTVMVVLVPIIAALVLAKKDFGTENHADEVSTARLVVNNAFIGIVLGAYQGFYGAGSGTLFLFAFCVLNRQDLLTASGSCKVVLFFCALSAALTYIAEGVVAWEFVPAIVAFNMVGAFVGSRLALTKGAQVIRPLFIVVLVGLILKLAYDLIV